MTTMPPAAAASATPTPRVRAEASIGQQALAWLSNLRLTVVLFALLIFLVFVGTLAQVDHDVWYVVNEGYFRVWFAWVELQGFVRLVEMFTKAEAQPIVGGFWFPGGKLIGVLMFANLLAAHTVRFKVAAKGGRLSTGLAVLAAGVIATFWVLAAGMDQSLKGQLSSEFCSGLWQAVRASIAGAALVGTYWSVQNHGRLRAPEWWLATICSASLLAVSVYLFANPSVSPDDAGMRIVWELSKCGGAAALSFLGCWMIFKQRAGIVLLHAGIGLLMVGELVTDLYAEEGQMRVAEGETVNYAYDIRTCELAVSTREADAVRVTVVPDHLLKAASVSDEPLSHPDLPFDLSVKRFDKNSILAPPREGLENPATKGAGLTRVALAGQSVSGVAVDAGVNLPSAYVEPLDKETGESLGVWLVSASYMPLDGGAGSSLLPQSVADGDAQHEVELRFKRLYKDYSVKLDDFRFDRYVGTNVPKNFSSDIVLKDPSRGVDRPVRIWMNNPLRYAGDTLYQSGYDEQTERATVLQVVTNGGWMIPYVSCMFVGLGMLSHFTITLTRFARRRVEEGNRLAAKAETSVADGPGRLSLGWWKQPRVWAPALVAVLAAGYFSGKARPLGDREDGMAIGRFGALPVAEGGRVKPIDTFARNTLQYLSSRQEVISAEEDGDRLSATEWMLDTLSRAKGWKDHRVFRIENLELLDLLDLKPRPGSFRYSYGEVMADPTATEAQFGRAYFQRKKIAEAKKEGREEEPLTLVQERTIRLASKVGAVQGFTLAFQEPPIGGEGADVRKQLNKAMAIAQQLRSSEAVRAVPPGTPDGTWGTVFETGLMNLMKFARKEPLNQAGVAWSDALTAYARGEATTFADKLTDLEAEIEKYERAVESDPEVRATLASSERLNASTVRFENSFNAFNPVFYCAVMYLVAFVLTALGWLGIGSLGNSGAGWPRVLGRCAMAVLLVTVAVHTFALVGRIYISGRPPVTNLYSSAVFIGWAAVLLGIAFEFIYRLSVGSAVASVIGFATLLVAHNLSLEGDTFTVLRAVLDTQFWLATHVVCITLGYSTTYLAGFLGAGYLLAACVPRLLGLDSRIDKRTADQLLRMTYGTLCFALLFSFVGTVLGGLWADDSWGRFWGWDPKENGALIIVLWNALVLHARWGKMTSPVGLAALAVGGNIVTTWSWFGVNELGVGLHAYGDSESSTAMWLLGFVASQLVVVALGCVAPKPRLA